MPVRPTLLLFAAFFLLTALFSVEDHPNQTGWWHSWSASSPSPSPRADLQSGVLSAVRMCSVHCAGCHSLDVGLADGGVGRLLSVTVDVADSNDGEVIAAGIDHINLVGTANHAAW